MRKAGILVCLVTFVAGVLLWLAQMWTNGTLMSAEIFFKLTLSLAGIFVISLAVVIVFGQFIEDKQLRDDDYIN